MGIARPQRFVLDLDQRRIPVALVTCVTTDPQGGSPIMQVQHHDIPGTTIFDGEQAQKGYALNRMCYSFNTAENRAAFLKDEDAYCAKYGLNAQQREAVRERNVLKLLAAGGNVYYLAKFAGILGLSVQDIGAQQTGMSVDAFKEKLLAAGR
jgi:protocatechuate 4,5-dioxygenase alpha chain